MTRRIYLQLVLCSFLDELTDPTLHTPLAAGNSHRVGDWNPRHLSRGDCRQLDGLLHCDTHEPEYGESMSAIPPARVKNG